MTTDLIDHPFLTAGIVLLLTIVWWLWGWLDKRRKRKWNKIEPKPPWDGIHRLLRIKYFEWHPNMDDFHTGWIWKCSCGISNDHLYWRLPHTEELAIAEYKKHKQHYTDLEKSFGS